MSIELSFEKKPTLFGYNNGYGVDCYVAETSKETAELYFLEREALPLGHLTVMPRIGKKNGPKAEVLKAFVFEGALYVCREIAGTVTIFNYFVGSTLTLVEAAQIWNQHREVCRLDLLAE